MYTSVYILAAKRLEFTVPVLQFHMHPPSMSIVKELGLIVQPPLPSIASKGSKCF